MKYKPFTKKFVLVWLIVNFLFWPINIYFISNSNKIGCLFLSTSYLIFSFLYGLISETTFYGNIEMYFKQKDRAKYEYIFYKNKKPEFQRSRKLKSFYFEIEDFKDDPQAIVIKKDEEIYEVISILLQFLTLGLVFVDLLLSLNLVYG